MRRTMVSESASRIAWAGWVLLVTLGGCQQVQCNRIEPGSRSTATGSQEVPGLRVLLTSWPVEEARISTTGAYSLRTESRPVMESQQAMKPQPVRREGAGWRVGLLFVEGRELVLSAATDQHVRLGEVTYRGLLRLLPDASGKLLVINHVDVEDYLAGVLSKELYPAWAAETYRATAVAARTFALYHATTYGTDHAYDVGDNQASQMYGGMTAETPRSRDAVEATRGIVLTYGPDGKERIFMAQYSACCGGRVNGAYVIRNAHRIEPLEGGQADADCGGCARYTWDPVRIAKGDIARALAARYDVAKKLGGLTRIDVQSATPYGRAVWVDAVGPSGVKARLRAEDVRLALIFDGLAAAKKLYSMNCTMADLGDAIEFRGGHGYGHGVGLCQWGAQGKAAKGWDAERILAFYYPGAKLYRAY
jgi:stage II sporulation protein D